MSDYYLIYDKKTLIPNAISGQPITDVPKGMATCRVREHEGVDFITFKKIMHDFKVHVVKGYAEFYSRWNETRHNKYTVPGNMLQDLSYRITFFLNLEITFSFVENILTLHFDASLLNLDARNNFNTLVNAKNGQCKIFVTKHGDPTALLETFELDLYELGQKKSQSVLLFTQETNISIWGIRQ
jgi:hypothetical protein